eukprot:TRINITY_DN12022_c0_g1_i1.p1 TRINITY_DN12022_c0_g1~~TRINITY_DN12022_c0_g1_i1.p1  ORF type:complete len:102 (-),score=14.64 TRINITY_DN12022_c0_g1_i1:563-868(-)
MTSIPSPSNLLNLARVRSNSCSAGFNDPNGSVWAKTRRKSSIVTSAATSLRDLIIPLSFFKTTYLRTSVGSHLALRGKSIKKAFNSGKPIEDDLGYSAERN